MENSININDSLDIVMIKLDLSISEKEAVKKIIEDETIGYEETEDYLSGEIGMEKAIKITEWMKLNQY